MRIIYKIHLQKIIKRTIPSKLRETPPSCINAKFYFSALFAQLALRSTIIFQQGSISLSHRTRETLGRSDAPAGKKEDRWCTHRNQTLLSHSPQLYNIHIYCASGLGATKRYYNLQTLCIHHLYRAPQARLQNTLLRPRCHNITHRSSITRQPKNPRITYPSPYRCVPTRREAPSSAVGQNNAHYPLCCSENLQRMHTRIHDLTSNLKTEQRIIASLFIIPRYRDTSHQKASLPREKPREKPNLLAQENPWWWAGGLIISFTPLRGLLHLH